ncbi:MAG: Re/Si-specific NAD(P)(+) transhydrogenase subunit alpha [Proteobacteria bacterium]|nr:Re/Si-specific NAD(P)(+) transhydrogenase subunit alpha [Pseudomonadota bacterium]
MKLVVLKETAPHEKRVALTPEVAAKLIQGGHNVWVETGAGLGSSILDEAFTKAGAQIFSDLSSTLKDADILLKVGVPSTNAARDELGPLKEGASLVAMLSPHTHKDLFARYNAKKLNCFSLELIPRITRAQSMDVLSSQSNLAGYRAVMEAAALYDKAFPMMMTAAGTVAPARVMILGAGVAGLQAIATAKRLGAIVCAFDVREAAKEQVESLAATFISVPANQGGETAGGYAKEMDDDYKARQAQKIKETLATQDIVITTALIPGRPAPQLITQDMVEGMKSGAIIVDMAVESGGNCAMSKLGEIVTTPNHVRIVGHPNLPSRIARDASALYARNMLNFLGLLLPQGETGPNWEDEILQKTLLTKEGATCHPDFKENTQ